MKTTTTLKIALAASAALIGILVANSQSLLDDKNFYKKKRDESEIERHDLELRLRKAEEIMKATSAESTFARSPFNTDKPFEFSPVVTNAMKEYAASPESSNDFKEFWLTLSKSNVLSK